MLFPPQKDLSKYYVKVGRFDSYEKEVSKQNGANILPVSCTVYTVEDSMDSICASWTFLAQAVKGGAGVAIDMSNIRPKGIIGRGGMVSKGVCNWLNIYSEIVIRVAQGRGGEKKGAGVVFLEASHKDLEEFLSLPMAAIPGLSRGVYIQPSDLNIPGVVESILTALSKGKVFLAKYCYNQRGERLYTNLCTEVLIKSQMTCILGQINLGLVTDFRLLLDIYVYAYQQLRDGRQSALDGIKESGHYLDPDDDKQIGLGVFGLANMLAHFNVKYSEFVDALDYVLDGGRLTYLFDTLAYRIAYSFMIAYEEVSRLAEQDGFDRVFAIAPTASVSYRNKDADGYTCTPEISPPVCHSETKIARRTTSEGFTTAQYPPNVEVADVNVSWQVYDRLVGAWQKMQNVESLGHSVSHNWWMSKPFTKENLEEFLASNRLTSYYTYPVVVDYADKRDVNDADLSSEDVNSFWGGDDGDENYDPMSNYCESCGN